MLYLTPVFTEQSVENAKKDSHRFLKEQREVLELLSQAEKDPALLIGEYLEVEELVDRDGNPFQDLTFSPEVVFRRNGHLYGLTEGIAVDLTVLAEVCNETIDAARGPARPKLFSL